MEEQAMAQGILEVVGTIDIGQFWPMGESDADTVHILLRVAPGAFRFRPDANAPFKGTHAFEGASVRGKTRKSVACVATAVGAWAARCARHAGEHLLGRHAGKSESRCAQDYPPAFRCRSVERDVAETLESASGHDPGALSRPRIHGG